MKKYCLAVDLKDDDALIAEYEHFHKAENSKPAITKSIKDAGITNLEIYRVGNRLFMIIEAEDTFEFAKKAAMDASNPDVQDWEELMWNFQQPLPSAAPGEKWMLMNKIYQLPE